MKRLIGTWHEEAALELKWPLARGAAQVQLQRAGAWHGAAALRGGLAVPEYSRVPGKAGRICKPTINSVQSPPVCQGAKGGEQQQWGTGLQQLGLLLLVRGEPRAACPSSRALRNFSFWRNGF